MPPAAAQRSVALTRALPLGLLAGPSARASTVLTRWLQCVAARCRTYSSATRGATPRATRIYPDKSAYFLNVYHCLTKNQLTFSIEHFSATYVNRCMTNRDPVIHIVIHGIICSLTREKGVSHLAVQKVRHVRQTSPYRRFGPVAGNISHTSPDDTRQLWRLPSAHFAERRCSRKRRSLSARTSLIEPWVHRKTPHLVVATFRRYKISL